MSVQISTLNKKVEILAQLRKDKDKAEAVVEALREGFEGTIKAEVAEVTKLKEGIAKYQDEVLEAMTNAGTKSWKTDHATVSLKHTASSFKVVDEKQLIDDLFKKKLDMYTKLTYTPEVKTLFGKEKFAGVEETEGRAYISVLLAKEDVDTNKNTQ